MDLKNVPPFKDPINILKTFGMWITDVNSKRYLTYSVIMHLVFVDLFTALQIIYLFMFETFEDFAKLMTLLPTYIGLIFKTLNLFFRYHEVEKLFETTKDLLEQCPDKTRISKRIEIADKIFKTTIFFSIITTSLGALATLYELPYKMWFPYDTDNRLLYWFSAAYQVFDTICFAFVLLSVDFLPVFFMSYAIGFLEVLCDRLASLKKKKIINIQPTKLVNNKSREEEICDNQIQCENYDEFKKCIQFQLKIDEYFKQIEKTFSIVLFVQGMMSVLILCTATLALTVVRRFLNNVDNRLIILIHRCPS